MRTLLTFFILACIHSMEAQVGINTTNPQGALDVVSTNAGLVVPRVSSIEVVTDTQGNPPQNGTIVYDELRQKTCHYINGKWACVGFAPNGDVESTLEVPVSQDPITYIKASNTDSSDRFSIISLSADGQYLAVGASGEDSAASGINGDQGDNSSSGSGAVYIFVMSGGTWMQQAYIKASNTDNSDSFGNALSINNDGSRLAVGANNEDSNAVGINGDQSDNSASNSGAVYVFVRTGTVWAQEAYIKASNTGAGDSFGTSLSLSGDGSKLAVGAAYEDSNATGINNDQMDNSAPSAGAVYVFSRTGTVWAQEAYIKSSNTQVIDQFGTSLNLDDDGTRLAVGALNEDSNATGVNGNQADNSASNSGAVYIYLRSGSIWTQEAYIKASNTDNGDAFGSSLSIDQDGSRLVVSAPTEDSNAIGINGDQNNNSLTRAGAAYVFTRSGTTWTQEAYIKASNTDGNDRFGSSAAISKDGTTVIVGAINEHSCATGINGIETDNSVSFSGAAYLFEYNGGAWSQTKYIKASNTNSLDAFGHNVSVISDGSVFCISTQNEDSAATGVSSGMTNQVDNSLSSSGAVYMYTN